MDDQQPKPNGKTQREPDASQVEADVVVCDRDLGRSGKVVQLGYPQVVCDLNHKLPVSEAELDAIFLLLGDDLEQLLAS